MSIVMSETVTKIIAEATPESKTCKKCDKPFSYSVKDTENELVIMAYCEDADKAFHMITCPICGGTCICAGNYYRCPVCGWHT